MISKEQMAALSAPFPIEAHTVREGFKNGGKTKIRWFAYVDVREVVKRLDEVFPGAWSTTKPEIIPISTGIIATIGITINGETRWYSGADDFDSDFKTGEVQPSADQGKGAVTDAIRRAASLWGVAEYIYSMDNEIWTDSYERNDWNKQKELKAEALNKFTAWYNKRFTQPKNAPKNAAPPTAQKPAQNGGNTQPDAVPTWFTTEVGKCWQAVKQYLLSEHIYTHENEMKNSFIKRGILVNGSLSEEWTKKPASELIAFCRDRHAGDIDFMGDMPKASGQ